MSDWSHLPRVTLLLLWLVILNHPGTRVRGNQPPTLINDMNLALIKEDTAVGTAIYQLHGEDPEGQPLRYGLKGTDLLEVNDSTGVVSLAKSINYETTQTLNLFVTVEDVDSEMQPKNKVESAVSLVILDVNDNSPKFAKESYDVFVTEETLANTTVLKIEVSDVDLVGSHLSVRCRSIPQFSIGCHLFNVVTTLSSNRNYTGHLILQQQLMYSQHPFLQLLLVSSVGDKHTFKLFDNRTAYTRPSEPVTVFVSPTRIPAPEISGPLYAIVNESLPKGSLVMKLKAKIPQRVKGRLAYSLLSNPRQLFSIHSQSGEIRTANVIDRESMSSPIVNLKIQVQVNEDGRQISEYKPIASVVDIVIAIRDTNDEPPTFNYPHKSIHCPENIITGHLLKNLNLFVKDPDVNKSELSITLEDESKLFDIDPRTASEGWAAIQIRLRNGPLDYENPNHRNFTLLVIAREESTEEKLSSTATVLVTIDDVNDNPPQFQLQRYTVTVEEMAKPNTTIATITATDRDGPKYGSSSIRYSLRGLGSELFSLDQNTGRLSVSNSTVDLDYETKSAYHLVYLATDTDGRGLITTVPLTVQLVDLDDNPPVFNRDHYDGIIYIGQVQLNPPLIAQAIDKDTVSNVSYEIVDGNSDDFFRIDPGTGEIKSANSSGIHLTSTVHTDRFQLTVIATDGGNHSATAIVSITIQGYENDVPVFERSIYNATVSEMAISGTFVHQISAKVSGFRRSNLTYQIVHGGRAKFRMGVKSGIVTVAKGARFDYDKHKIYLLQMRAVDEGVAGTSSATATLVVHVEDANNKPPVLTPPFQTAQVFENAKVGQVVHKVNATDPDASSLADLKFSIVSGVNNISSHKLPINNCFEMDANSGEIKVAGPLSRRDGSDIVLSVLVVDSSAPIPQTSTGAVLISIVKINKFPPTFPPPWTPDTANVSISIVEEQPVGSIVYTFIAIDRDWDIEGYALLSTHHDLLQVDTASGVVTTNNRVDYERVQTITFSLVAFDTGVPQMSSTALVTASVVNLNDNDPVFNSSHYAVDIKEHSAVNTYVTTVTATDNDLGEFGRVNYKLLGTRSEAFTVDTAGVVRVKDPTLLDRETTTTLTFYVMAEDHDHQPRSTSAPIIVTLLDINDHGPKFTQHEYSVSIMDNIIVFPPTPILQMTAKDKDEHGNGLVAYSIIDGNPDGIFSLNSANGMLFPNVSLVGRPKQHVLKVIARDLNGTGPNYDLATVRVEVQEVNSNAPRIVAPSIKNSTIYVEENVVGDGHIVCTIFADDPDQGKNGHIRYFIKDDGRNILETETFSINSHSGQLRLNGPLDREQRSKHVLIVVAKDEGIPRPFETLQQLIVVVKDVNDNEPHFPRSQFTDPYTFEVKENLQIGSLVGQIEAIDADSEDNSNIYYYIIEADEDGTLAVDKLTGSIYTNRSLDFETKREYRLLVKATNYPTAPKTKSCPGTDETCVRVYVYVVDVNDNVPTFRHSPYTAGVSYEAPIGHVVIDVAADDPDQEDDGRLMYTIEKTTLFSPGTRDSAKVLDRSPFAIDHRGQVVTDSLVNVYQYDHFKLVIQCKEAAPSAKSATTTLEVWVYDEGQLTKMIVDKYVEEVKPTLAFIASEISNVTEGIAVVAEINEKVTMESEAEAVVSQTELGVLIVDTKKRAIKPVRDVISNIVFNFNRLQPHIRLSPSHQEVSGVSGREEHATLVLGALIGLCAVLGLGLILVIITIKCMRRWYIRHQTQAAVKLRRDAIEPSVTTENPLWIDQISRIYEEQEIGLSVSPGQLDQMPGRSTSLADVSNANAASAANNEAMYATIRRNARSTRENLRTMEENAFVNHVEWSNRNHSLQREQLNQQQQHRNVCHVSPTYLPPPPIHDLDNQHLCQSGIL